MLVIWYNARIERIGTMDRSRIFFEICLMEVLLTLNNNVVHEREQSDERVASVQINDQGEPDRVRRRTRVMKEGGGRKK